MQEKNSRLITKKGSLRASKHFQLKLSKYKYFIISSPSITQANVTHPFVTKAKPSCRLPDMLSFFLVFHPHYIY